MQVAVGYSWISTRMNPANCFTDSPGSLASSPWINGSTAIPRKLRGGFPKPPRTARFPARKSLEEFAFEHVHGLNRQL